MLRYIRIIAAAAVLLLSLLLFLDFAELIPRGLSDLMRMQFIPAVMDRRWLAIILLLVSVLLFGRIYCSVLCPFGILQDVVIRVKRFFAWIVRAGKKKKNPKKQYRKPYNYVRYGVLALSIIPVLFGSTVILTLLDPYSNFGRIAMGLFRPVYVWGNNILASAMNAAGNYSLYNVTQDIVPSLAIFAGVVLVIVIIMAVGRGRLWCNTICPVGALFGLISKYSFFRISINSKCTHCNKCVNVCKAECIDQKNFKVDTSRCVACYNCLNVCKFDAIHYSSCKKKNTEAVVKEKNTTAAKSSKETRGEIKATVADYDKSRRRFIASAATSLAVIPFAGISSDFSREVLRTRKFPLPPGATENFTNQCTGCQLCVAKCPMHVIRPSFLERGISGIMQPHLYFEPHKYCNYECTICSEVCPNGALQHLTVEEKKVRQIGVVHFVKDECIVYKDNMDCGACAEHCPTQAVKMVPYEGTLTIPETDQEICIGCGACESICPVRPYAIFIEGIDRQGTAEIPEETVQEEVTIDGFGF